MMQSDLLRAAQILEANYDGEAEVEIPLRPTEIDRQVIAAFFGDPTDAE